MRSLYRTSLFVGVGILAVLAMGTRMAAAGDPKPETMFESLARAQATVTSSDANLVKAQASWVQAIYSVRKTAAETAKMLQEVRSMRLANEMKTADTFFQKRERREQYVAKHPRVRPDLETYRRICNSYLPTKMVSMELSGGRTIYWPELLQRSEFDEYRHQLDALFAARPTKRDSEIDRLEFQHRVESVARQMRDQLKEKVHEVSQMEYIAAKKFIMSLAYEACQDQDDGPPLNQTAAN
jgi:hypothetical protein